ncbi:Ethylene-responsive transcription factor RAP2-11 [Senna tora]|uniref:Ethylene-responsive transcription factor RAP2-11 n=1 Tax=Senna tora TaxID=362788 RepID=A0A835CFK6_9FABA|nr:Ethylene-responsive transcription factor RAP2-11 [Senna tora]
MIMDNKIGAKGMKNDDKRKLVGVRQRASGKWVADISLPRKLLVLMILEPTSLLIFLPILQSPSKSKTQSTSANSLLEGMSEWCMDNAYDVNNAFWDSYTYTTTLCLTSCLDYPRSQSHSKLTCIHL